MEEPLELIDIGVNLTNSSFRDDLSEVLHAARNAQVITQILTGTDVEDSKQALVLAEKHGLYSTAGVHPHQASTWNASSEEELRKLLVNQRVVAVGECGLDFNRNYSSPEEQQRSFEHQIQLAKDFGLPMFLHERDAFEDMTKILSRQSFPKSVIHCFTGGSEQAQAYLALGLDIGITGWICDERRNHDVVKALEVIPLERLLVETDSPYLLPRTIQPKPKTRRNEPKYLIAVCEKIAEILGVEVSAVARATTENARRLFTKMSDA